MRNGKLHIYMLKLQSCAGYTFLDCNFTTDRISHPLYTLKEIKELKPVRLYTPYTRTVTWVHVVLNPQKANKRHARSYNMLYMCAWCGKKVAIVTWQRKRVPCQTFWPRKDPSQTHACQETGMRNKKSLPFNISQRAALFVRMLNFARSHTFMAPSLSIVSWNWHLPRAHFTSICSILYAIYTQHEITVDAVTNLDGSAFTSIY